jgi:hypothetical protein
MKASPEPFCCLKVIVGVVQLGYPHQQVDILHRCLFARFSLSGGGSSCYHDCDELAGVPYLINLIWIGEEAGWW